MRSATVHLLALTAVAAALLAHGSVWAQPSVAPRAARLLAPTGGEASALAGWREANERTGDAPLSEFKLINYFFTRVSATNQLADPAGLKGVALGPLGASAGSATRVLPNAATFFVEQRWIPVIEYTPWFVDGLAAFRAQFEVDYMWGRSANAVQPNVGGGFNADQVNLQTKNINVALYPTGEPNDLAIVLGTQPVYDTLQDPTRTSLFDIVRTGYKLAYLGSDATGVSLYSSTRYGHAKASALFLGSEQADKALLDDPRLSYALLFTGDYGYTVQPGTVVSASVWRLQDNTKGEAWAYEGLVKSGPGSTGLPSYMGTPRLPIERASGGVTFLGLNAHHNLDFKTGPFAASGFFMYSAGRFDSDSATTALQPSLTVAGFAANAEVAYNFGRTANDVATFEVMVASGDDDLGDGRYTGPFTTNFYGLPGAVWFNHKTLLLFPFTSTVSNYTGAVTDLSNQGYGLRAAIATAAYDVIPNKLNAKLGAAFATSSSVPAELTPGVRRGKTLGTELNAELKYHLKYLMTVGLHGAYLLRGNFYQGSDTVTDNPWAAFTTFTWYGF